MNPFARAGEGPPTLDGLGKTMKQTKYQHPARSSCAGKPANLCRCLAAWLVMLWMFWSGTMWAATLPVGFSETTIPGPNAGLWDGAVGVSFEDNGRMYVWEGGGRVYFKDPADSGFTLLLDISEEVGLWVDHGMLSFVLDPDFRVNGFIYVLYVVDRHHLMNFGTGGYNPNTDDFFSATIGRLTRYTANSADGFRSVNPASRFILLGETRQTGIPVCSSTHGVGTMVFAEDGTLLVTTGDGASPNTADVGGAAFGSYAPQALTDGILKPKENIGAFRSQLVDCLSGKMLRLDPATGNGVPSNPFWDGANPRSAKSRVWVLGLRNPFRMAMRPESGSHNQEDANPGVLYVGDVGWDIWECLKVVTGPAQNFGWPIYEGLSVMALYDQDIPNQDAPNPLFPGGGCNQYFSFKQLLKEDTLLPANFPPFNNPCNAGVKIPNSIPQFLHTRPVLDWNHASAITRTPTFTSGNATIANVGAGGSPVSGSQFQGNCSIGGVWYTAAAFPTQYFNTYFHADWGQGVIKNLTFDANDRPVSLNNFASAAGAVVCMAAHPTDGSLYYVSYISGDAGTIRQLAYTGNRTPVVAASADQIYGPTPLGVQFSSAGSSDPDGSPLTYSWNFGDGSPLSTQANPAHSFTAPPGVPTKFTVTLTVSDTGGLNASTNFAVSVNNTPPSVALSNPLDGALYSPSIATTVSLSAVVSDVQSSNSQLAYFWQTLLRHNNHEHFVIASTNQTSTTVLSPIGCDGINIYHYRILLTVTDPAGLATTREVGMYADCGATDTPPTISNIGNQTIPQDQPTSPIAFTIGDGQVAAINLQLNATSSNPTLVPPGSFEFGGSSSNRTLVVTPALGQVGTATITVFVDDGPNLVSDTFVLTVTPPAPGTRSYTNSTSIIVSVPDQGPATPYPSYLPVNGLGGTITNVTVTLNNLTYSWAADLDVLLVSPSGQGIVLMSDAGGAAVNDVTLTFSDAAVPSLPASGAIASGTYKPTNFGAGDTFAAPAPAGPYSTTLAAFNGQNPNGSWALYVFDDGAGDTGLFANGWKLTISTAGTGNQPPTISDIANQTTTVDVPTAAIPFTVGDAETPAASLALIRASSNPTLVPTNNMVFGGSGSNRTVTVTPAAGQTGTATLTVSVSDGTNTTSDNFLLTVNVVNTPPTLTGIADQIINEDTVAGPLSFTIGDGQTAAASLTLGKASSNASLVPTNNIVFGGSASNRTVTITPATNATGSAIITLSVSDGQATTSTNFLVTVNAVDDAPTISNISNLATPYETPTAAILFTVGDVDTAVASLTVSGGSSNPALVPTNNIVFGGSGSNRTVTLTPSTGQTGTVTLTVIVSDGNGSAQDTFVLTVNPPNAPPVISAVADQIVNEDTATALLNFTIGDAETAATNLVVGRASSNPALVPTNNIVLGGSGSNRTVWVTPATNQNGTALITLTVSDGQATTSTNFLLTVNPVNDAPALTGFANQSTTVGGTVGPLSFTIGDVETAAASLIVSGGSSNPALVPTNNIVFGGSGSNRTVSVTAAPGLSGTATITLSVSDGTNTASTNFLLTVSTLISGTFAFTNAATIYLTNPVPSAANPYPSTINVSGLAGVVSNVTVTLRGLTHSWTRDIDVLLVGPAGQKVMICSDAGNGGANNATFTLSDAAVAALPLSQLVSGTYQPDDYEAGEIQPAPAPAGPYETLLSSFNGQTPNGTWSLFVADDGNDDVGSFAGGWSITLTAVSDGLQPPTISSVSGQTMVEDSSTEPLSFTVGDPDTAATSLVMSGGSSNPALVPSGNIVFGGSGSNRTVTVTSLANASGTATITLTVSDGATNTSANFLLTVTPVNDAPALTGVADQIINEDGATAALGFVVGDVETAAGSLVVTRGSSNSALVPTNNIVFGGSASNLTVTITPAPDASGTALITLTVSDGTNSVSTNFLLTVNAVNDLPTITGIADQTIDEDGATAALGFVIGDVDMAAGGLTLTRGSSNLALVPTNNIVFGGADENRTVTVTPAPDANGTALITLTVSDGTNSVSTNFLLTVNAVNDTPTISGVADQTIDEDGTTAALGFVVGDVETAAGSLVLTKGSSNPALVPTNNIVFDGADANRTVTVTPTPDASGTALITLTVSDGTNSVSTNFLLTVNAVNDAPVFAAISNHVLNAGQTLSFTNSATDIDQPQQALVFSLLDFPAGATVDPSSGLFSWRPTVAQAGLTNIIQVRVVDDGVPSLGATQSFSVIVNPLVLPSVAHSSIAGEVFSLVVMGPVGPDYTVLASPDLLSWEAVFTTNAPPVPFSCTFTNVVGLPTRFFRIQVGP